MIILRFGARALPLNPIVWRKADRIYRCRITFSPSAINKYFMLARPDKDILCGLSPGYGYFSGGSFWDTERLSRSWLLLELFFCLCFFLLFNKRTLLLILLTQTRQFRVLFLLWKNYTCRRPCIWGGKLCWLLIMSPITRLVALKCGSALE